MANTNPNKEMLTRTAFHEALKALIHRARENDVNVNGGWECRTNGNGDYEAVIVELTSVGE